MTDEKMKLLTLDRWAAFNLEKWGKEMGMNLSSAAEEMAVARARRRAGKWRGGEEGEEGIEGRI